MQKVLVSKCATEIGCSKSYIRKLIKLGKIKEYGQELGIALVDLDEVKAYKNNPQKRGRKSITK